ncbi:MAG: cell division protein FtsZ [Bacteroidales bacterium]|nr:cell division protein FtsZ [Bacteroidales bacterium]
MTDLLEFDAPKQRASIIKVIGVGGGGSNAVTHMYQQGIKGVDFIICNTDAQAMDTSPIPNKIQLGDRGLGAGAIPDVGRQAAEANIDDIRSYLESNTKMLFITAGMGGGTGTGAAPVIAKIAREMDILTVAIVTIPFSFEGRKRRLQAEKGIEELKKNVDTLLIISNEKLREMHGNLKLSEAFGRADDILTTAAKGIAEIITVTGYINVDFEDVKTVMKNSGTAIMGSAVAEGPDRAQVAVREALSSPLLNDNKITGASDILLYISSGKEEITFDEVGEITDYIQQEAGQSAEVIWGNGYDEELGDKISITLIATGFNSPEDIDETTFNREKKKTVYSLGDSLPSANTITPPQPESTEKKLKVEEVNTESISEITLIKKERIPESQNNGNETRQHHTETPSLFDQLRQETSERANPKPLYEKKEITEPVAISNNSNNNLRIKHTVGSFAQKPELSESSNQEREQMQKKANERVKKLQELSFLQKNPIQHTEDLEKIPAYVRKQIELKPVMASAESNISRFVLGEDDDNGIELKTNDIPYIHNKPD